MKTLALVILTTLSLGAFAQNLKPTRAYRVTRTLIADLNNDHRPDTIRLLSPFDDWNSFNKITITLTGYGKTTLKAKDYWTVVDSDFLATHKNAIHTKLLFVRSTPVHSVILLFGYMYGDGYRGEFSVINVENNKVSMPLDFVKTGIDPNVAWATALTDLDHDGRLDFIFGDLGESYCPGPVPHTELGTYSPYLVYKITDSSHLDKPLTKAYNQKHYVFAGYQYSEKIKIIYPENGGKPWVWKEKAKK